MGVGVKFHALLQSLVRIGVKFLLQRMEDDRSLK